MNEEYYRRQILGLIKILDDRGDKDTFITRDYVKEKLTMILNGGIGFHPALLADYDESENKQ